MKAIITVIGKDKVGIISGISTELTNHSINILDVNQTIMGGSFTMMMMVEIQSIDNFDKVSKALTLKGEELEVDIKIQREEIFKAMHTI